MLSNVFEMNILSFPYVNECTSCQMCAVVCPRNAIHIRLNEDGFYRPIVDENNCTDCGLCTKFCYKYDDSVEVTSAEDIDKIAVYSAQHISNELLKKVTSGGVADVLAKEFVNIGYVCIGVTYNNDNRRAEHIVASTIEQTDSFRGSKYIQSYSYNAFKELVKNVRTTRFAIFGLPCQIYAIDRFLKLRNQRENCILVDLFCHGCPSMHVWEKYGLNIRKQVGNKRFDNVQFRSKVKGWGAFHIEVDIDGKKEFVSTPHNDEFYSLYFSDQVLNDACADCKLRSTMEYTDIRLGDFWGKRFLGDTKGVSAVVIKSEKGEQVFDAIKEQFKTERFSLNEVIEKQSYGKSYFPNPSLRKMMLNALKDDTISLKEIEKLYCSKQGLIFKLKRLVKIIDWYLPFDLTRLLKRLA